MQHKNGYRPRFLELGKIFESPEGIEAVTSGFVVVDKVFRRRPSPILQEQLDEYQRRWEAGERW